MKEITNPSNELAETSRRLPENGIDATASFAHAAAPAQPPEVVGRYKVTGQIGAGAFGVVYKAVGEQLQREVAIKIVRPPAEEDEEDASESNLLAEARLMGNCGTFRCIGTHWRTRSSGRGAATVQSDFPGAPQGDFVIISQARDDA